MLAGGGMLLRVMDPRSLRWRLREDWTGTELKGCKVTMHLNGLASGKKFWNFHWILAMQLAICHVETNRNVHSV